MRTNSTNHKMTWRKFQQDLQLESHRNEAHSKVKKRVISVICILSLILLGRTLLPGLSSSIPTSVDTLTRYPIQVMQSAIQLINTLLPDTSKENKSASHQNANDDSPGYVEKKSLTTRQIRQIFNSHPQSILNTRSGQLTFTENGERLTIDTTLDMNLQHFLLDQIEAVKKLNRGKPEIIAMVVMEPQTGKILAMTGFDNQTHCDNPCTQGQYPAASLFKMVTASAAVETCGFSPRTELYFNGGKYTLYKRQLKANKDKYSNKVTFANAFAESINPVFGKLGSFKLGGDILEAYATSFGFNQKIESDMPFIPGKIIVTDNNSYQWAEVASGFNKTTTISPLFGAMLAATLLNEGRTPIPSVVASVTNESGQSYYTHTTELMGTPIQPTTAKAIMAMMNKTITKGTARKSFKGLRKDETLSKLNIGGKTGSLYNREHTVKFDWFAGFCKEPHGKEQIVVSVVVGHGKYIGTRASRFGRRIFTEYFNNFYAANAVKSNNG